jgi:serine/threonine protein kinase/tetratricopeptide (TPR) repeat protein
MSDQPTIDEIFCNAIEIELVDERHAFLERVCGDDRAVRGQVDRLLQAHFRGGRIVDAPALAIYPALPQLIVDGPGTQIGPYKLLEEIGQGGMGVVYLAEQHEPVRRKVALKVIKPGMDTRQVVARFAAERQALAMMNHPHIAKVLDAGQTATGRPYFAMELVKGIPVTEYCNEHQLSLCERLELFATVCRAVQHAHQKGIIHRDLKPSNVLVERHDVVAVPKVIDFGIAKAVEHRLTDQTPHTGFRQLVGTPLYMSPEQSQLSGLDIDTRSDIYSLGVVLYELLTGTTPFDSQTLREAGDDAMRRIIQEVDPPRPSERVTTMPMAELSTICQSRGIDSRRLCHAMRGELDWIVMKALEKDRSRRYETAGALAADLERYLRGEPVQAGPPSVFYHFKKYARRHRVAITAGVLVALALVAGTVVSTWQAVEAIAARRRADEQRGRADANYDLARRAVSETVVHIAAAPRLQTVAFEDLRRELLSGVLPFYEELTRQHGDDPDIEAERAAAFLQLGRIHDALGAHAEAQADYVHAREILSRLSDEHPRSPGYRQGLAACRDSLGCLLMDIGRVGEAETELRAAVELREALSAESPNNATLRRDLAGTRYNLARSLRRLNRREEALTAYTAAQEIQRTLSAEFPEDVTYRSDLANTYLGRGILLAQARQWQTAEVDLRAALALHQAVAAAQPESPQYAENAANACGNLAIVRAEQGDHAEAAKLDDQAMAIRQKLAADFPEIPGYALGLAGNYCNVANSLRDAGQPEASLEPYGRAIAVLSSLLQRAPNLVEGRLFLRNAHGGRARALCDLDRFGESLADADRALALADGPEQASFRIERARVLLYIDPAAAITEIEALLAEANVSGGALYDAACFFTQLAQRTDLPSDAERHATRAVALLQKARGVGFFQAPALVAHLNRDHDLDPLRARPDFLDLIGLLDAPGQK